jgi:hypothetical protein
MFSQTIAPTGAACSAAWPEREINSMSTLLIIVVLLLVFGGGGGYYGYNRYGPRGLGGALSFVLLIMVVLWVLGVLV